LPKAGSFSDSRPLRQTEIPWAEAVKAIAKQEKTATALAGLKKLNAVRIAFAILSRLEEEVDP